jgi:hypothetical protein
MRAKEFITETTGSILPDVQRTLPATWVIPDLKNSDFYMQYRFGVALAGAKGKEQRKKDNVPEYSKESPWGENEVIVSYAGRQPLEKYIDDALSDMGMAGAQRQITTSKSEEPIGTGKTSLLKGFKGYPK